jgi:2-oxoglutarate ferredoxin oxidoreductase subunit beta
VTFNDHEGSTKSYEYTRQHFQPATATDYIQPSKEILAQYDEGQALPVSLHDGSQIVLRKVDHDYDPTDRAFVYSFLERHQMAGEIVTGLLYYDDSQQEMHDLSKIVDRPLSSIDYKDLCPGQSVLQNLQHSFR